MNINSQDSAHASIKTDTVIDDHSTHDTGIINGRKVKPASNISSNTFASIAVSHQDTSLIDRPLRIRLDHYLQLAGATIEEDKLCEESDEESDEKWCEDSDEKWCEDSGEKWCEDPDGDKWTPSEYSSNFEESTISSNLDSNC